MSLEKDKAPTLYINSQARTAGGNTSSFSWAPDPTQFITSAKISDHINFQQATLYNSFYNIVPPPNTYNISTNATSPGSLYASGNVDGLSPHFVFSTNGGSTWTTIFIPVGFYTYAQLTAAITAANANITFTINSVSNLCTCSISASAGLFVILRTQCTDLLGFTDRALNQWWQPQNLLVQTGAQNIIAQSPVDMLLIKKVYIYVSTNAEFPCLSVFPKRDSLSQYTNSAITQFGATSMQPFFGWASSSDGLNANSSRSFINDGRSVIASVPMDVPYGTLKVHIPHPQEYPLEIDLRTGKQWNVLLLDEWLNPLSNNGLDWSMTLHVYF